MSDYPAMRTFFYTLRGHEVVPCDVKEWERMFASDERIVARSTLGEGYVSTVFLGMDNGFGLGPSLFFETAIYTEAFAIYGRVGTWDEAEAMHQSAISYVRDVMLKIEIALERASNTDT